MRTQILVAQMVALGKGVGGGHRRDERQDIRGQDETKPAQSVSLQITPSGVQELEKSLDSGSCCPEDSGSPFPGPCLPLLAFSMQPVVPQVMEVGFL